ncbi:ABC transporter substrate-binding protein [Bradyrhizobium sp. ISRA443]|uniref:ABC transporter substrate-binding protein n=1 Tax=unclassified Bradyrhizobium TaxID=2631580 RepID=UPI00247868C9|nr:MULTISPECIES: ABC transporter substrate-binding protein [unclassified Bradyrhizobium]WGR92392.1 ABC transporter substrate-binding protein [Bradyrhizobium sp. ISRA435]WGR96745.1 ABC transporter substrate-binding protein [Bradyrhizobium sp. ISRA436]WGS03632.1 ABC transporter substrate-binding protein [Bradyrhizobium sp. ISRA437]WGS10516.1 ABC transporter substrate-binding protein [Bradyrhizobium sp. ISRA443]
MWRKRSTFAAWAALALALAATPATAQSHYGPGATDHEIKIGTTTPYSGPASAYSAGAISITAYFAMINDQGGVNGRKINFISLDDAYSPPKTVEQIRRLIESDEVLFLVNPVGTAPNMAVVKYINQKRVPHLFVGSGATIFNDPGHYPWTMSWTPHYASEGEIYARYILSTLPDAKIGILAQNDDLGRDYVMGFKHGLGDKAATMIVSQQTYNTSDPTVDSQIVSLRAAGANVLFIASVPKFAAQAIRKAYDIDWHPQEFLSSVGSSIAGAIRPAGFEAAKGVISAAYQKDPADPQWKDDPAMKAWNVWMDKYNPHVDKSDYYAPYGYNIGYAVVQILKQCGNDLTRENIMKQASHLDMELPLLLPGIRLRTSPTDLRPIKQMRLVRFNGQRYVLFSDVLESN